MESQTQVLQRRLRRSERLVRLMTGGCLLSLTIALIAGARAAQDFIELKDPNSSKVRIRLNTNPATGSTGIEIMDQAGNRRIWLGTSSTDIPGLVFFGVNGNEVKEITP
jgi:hypothetical protein